MADIIQPEVPHLTIPYIDDVPVKEPQSMYQHSDGTFKTIPDNPGFCQFIGNTSKN